MGLILVLLFLFIVVASMLGWTADSRDAADWRPSESGRRRPHWPAYPD